jgi:ABC-type multidrug transport system fused ATPase/permease subunit
VKTKLLTRYALALLGMVLLARTFDSWRDYRTHALNARVLSRVRRMLYGHLLRFPLARLHDIKTGGVISRAWITGSAGEATCGRS